MRVNAFMPMKMARDPEGEQRSRKKAENEELFVTAEKGTEKRTNKVVKAAEDEHELQNRSLFISSCPLPYFRVPLPPSLPCLLLQPHR